MEKRVAVKRYVAQIREGKDYKGYVKINENQFDYKLHFTVLIPELEKMYPINPDRFHSLFKISVAKKDEEIELDEDLYNFFFQVLVDFAIDFAINPRTIDANKGFLGRTVRGENPILSFSFDEPNVQPTVLAYKDSGIMEIPSRILEVLGCS
jgi:hypothetical protein